MTKIHVSLNVKGLQISDRLAVRLRAGDAAAFIELEAVCIKVMTRPEAQTALVCDSIEIESAVDAV